MPTAVGFYFESADLATRVARAISAEGVPARKVYGGKPVYANPSILHQRTISSTGRPFTDPLYLARGPKMEYAMGMCPRSEDYLAAASSSASRRLMTEADAEDVVTAVEKVVRAFAGLARPGAPTGRAARFVTCPPPSGRLIRLPCELDTTVPGANPGLYCRHRVDLVQHAVNLSSSLEPRPEALQEGLRCLGGQQ